MSRAENAEEVADLSSGVIHKLMADLAAARAFIREVTGLRSSSWKKAEEEYPEHAPAIAAARSEGGG